MYQPVLDAEQLMQLEISPDKEPFDNDNFKFHCAVEAMRLNLAYEYDPFFALSVARVEPLPHPLETVYDYFLKLLRIRFLLADDPGVGKTVMAEPRMGKRWYRSTLWGLSTSILVSSVSAKYR